MNLFKAQTNPLGEWMAFTNRLDNDHITRLHLTLSIFMFASFLVFIPAWLLDSRVLEWTRVPSRSQHRTYALRRSRG